MAVILDGYFLHWYLWETFLKILYKNHGYKLNRVVLICPDLDCESCFFFSFAFHSLKPSLYLIFRPSPLRVMRIVRAWVQCSYFLWWNL